MSLVNIIAREGLQTAPQLCAITAIRFKNTKGKSKDGKDVKGKAKHSVDAVVKEKTVATKVIKEKGKEKTVEAEEKTKEVIKKVAGEMDNIVKAEKDTFRKEGKKVAQLMDDAGKKLEKKLEHIIKKD